MGEAYAPHAPALRLVRGSTRRTSSQLARVHVVRGSQGLRGQLRRGDLRRPAREDGRRTLRTRSGHAAATRSRLHHPSRRRAPLRRGRSPREVGSEFGADVQKRGDCLDPSTSVVRSVAVGRRPRCPTATRVGRRAGVAKAAL
jgi:hypothetical protein